MAKKKFDKTIMFSIFFGATLAYFIWLSWSKITEWIGNSTIVWIITGVITLFGLFSGYLSLKKIKEKFT